jgi:3-oxoacyl-[acyl-carrier protein] reductase
VTVGRRFEPELDGRVAVVTGGSRGIGAAVCERLVARGAVVYCVARDVAAAGPLRESLGGDAGRLVLAGADVTDPSELGAVFARVEAERSRLDILVNCAGAASDGLLLRTSDERLRAGLRLNLEAAMAASRAALKPMLARRYGRIVSISSVVAAAGNAGQTVYAAAKAGLEGFTRSLAREVGSRGITVNCVAPGLIETRMTDALGGPARDRALEATALGRAGTPAEVAAAVGFLCGEDAAYVTGTVLQVNGGMYM